MVKQMGIYLIMYEFVSFKLYVINDCCLCVKKGMKIIVCIINQIWDYEEIFLKMVLKCNIGIVQINIRIVFKVKYEKLLLNYLLVGFLYMYF